ncbi:MAG: PQQ-dependent sugar dehydrogenase, partial [Saprospiraceae bacterium]|nr:PQQ-dependent sugar dehydrogenase [Saprospiraceae bacterium]
MKNTRIGFSISDFGFTIGQSASLSNIGLVVQKSIFLTLALLFAQNTNAQTVSLTPHASGFNWLAGVERAPGDPRLYAFTKDGYVRIINTDGTVLPTPFLDINAQSNNSWNNEQGLVGLAFHPDYQANGLFYVFYNQKTTGDCTISRFMRSAANPDQADPISEGILLTYEHPLPNHVGGCMKFGPDGFLYIGTGDGGGAGDPEASGQNMLSFKGKILRINVGSQGNAYTIPANNPYINALDTIAPEIWASGLRNPWRFNFDAWTGDLWIGDVGQDAREEINFQPANSLGGVNYGWSCMEGTLPFNNSQCFAWNTLTGPLYEYTHDGQECSITGGTVYRGTKYADLFGKYIFTDFCAGKIWALSNDGVPTVVEMGNFNDNDFTGIEADNTGELYAVGYFTNNIYKITSNNCAPVAWLVAEPNMALPMGGSLQLNAYGNDLNYQWLLNGQPIAGANSNSLTVNAAGTYSVKVTNPANGCSNTSNETVVTAPVALSASVSTVDVKCFGDATGSASVVAVGGTQNYTYHWSNGATTASISGLPAGVYSVTVSDGNGSVMLEAT